MSLPSTTIQEEHDDNDTFLNPLSKVCDHLHIHFMKHQLKRVLKDILSDIAAPPPPATDFGKNY